MLESLRGFDRWLDPVEAKSEHCEECPYYVDPDIQLVSENKVECICESRN